ncbi:hypothetical protein PHYC_01037 [Phycisphaerales bacterium]|nr:hypothetical protein PHYC_01037 [Phycisphaerales bacterium]
MVYFGKYHNGKIVPETDLRLPEGSRVRIEPIPEAGPAPQESDPFDTLGDQPVDDPSLPADLAAEHDHYIYGTPKRGQNGQGRR